MNPLYQLYVQIEPFHLHYVSKIVEEIHDLPWTPQQVFQECKWMRSYLSWFDCHTSYWSFILLYNISATTNEQTIVFPKQLVYPGTLM